MSIMKQQSINQLIARINRLQAIVACRSARIKDENSEVLIEEVMNLLDGVGVGWTAGDYYAEARYYSRIPGVKNIRMYQTFDNQPAVLVKITSPLGELLPDIISVRNVDYKVVYMCSGRYSAEVDY